MLPAVFLINVGGALRALGILLIIAAALGLLLLILLVSLALSVLVTLVREFAFRACVIDAQGIFDSLRASITLARTRLREAVFTWLLLLAINIAFGVLVTPLALIGIAGGLAPILAAFGVTRSVGAAALVSIPVVLVIFAIAGFIGGLYLIFHSAVWTLVFRELSSREVLAEAN